MDEKLDLSNMRSSLNFLRAIVASLAILCFVLVGTSCYLIIENQTHHQSIDFLRESNAVLTAEVTALQEWRRERSASSDKPVVNSVQKREVLLGQGESLTDLLNAVQGLRGPPGSPGEDGDDGRDGRDGADGDDGKDGADGADGVDGRDGRDAVNFAAVDRHINTTVQHIVDQEMSKVRLATKEIPRVASTVYTRWGRTVCPSTSDLVMKGIAAGTSHSTQGGAAQYICLPEDPDVSSIQPPSYNTKISGVEYENTNFPSGPMQDQNAPCVVCQTKGNAVQSVFPAKSRCPDSTWTKEYNGFLMTENDTHHRSEFVCVDSQPESIPGHAHGTNGALWYHTVADCSSGHGALGACPPYTANTVILCVVCSK